MSFLLCLPNVLTHRVCPIFVSSKRYESKYIIYIHYAYSLVVQCELYCLCVKISIVNIFYLAACDIVVMVCVVMFVLAHTIEVAS